MKCNFVLTRSNQTLSMNSIITLTIIYSRRVNLFNDILAVLTDNFVVSVKTNAEMRIKAEEYVARITERMNIYARNGVKA